MVLIFQTNMVIMSFLTNPIIDGIGEEANEGNMIQILTQLLVQPGGVFSFCQSFPMVRMFLSPPPESQSQAFLVPSFSSCHSSDYVAAFRV